MALFTVGMRTLVHSAENHCTLMVPTRILIWKVRQKQIPLLISTLKRDDREKSNGSMNACCLKSNTFY